MFNLCHLRLLQHCSTDSLTIMASARLGRGPIEGALYSREAHLKWFLCSRYKPGQRSVALKDAEALVHKLAATEASRPHHHHSSSTGNGSANGSSHHGHLGAPQAPPDSDVKATVHVLNALQLFVQLEDHEALTQTVEVPIATGHYNADHGSQVPRYCVHLLRLPGS